MECGTRVSVQQTTVDVQGTLVVIPLSKSRSVSGGEKTLRGTKKINK